MGVGFHPSPQRKQGNAFAVISRAEHSRVSALVLAHSEHASAPRRVELLDRHAHESLEFQHAC